MITTNPPMESEISQAPENVTSQGSSSNFVSVVNETLERESVRQKYSHLIKRFGDSPKKCSLPKVSSMAGRNFLQNSDPSHPYRGLF